MKQNKNKILLGDEGPSDVGEGTVRRIRKYIMYFLSYLHIFLSVLLLIAWGFDFYKHPYNYFGSGIQYKLFIY